MADILALVKLCRVIKWADGVLFFIESEVTKNQFLIGTLQGKINLV